MKAVLSKEVGGPETLVVEDIAEPTAGKGEVLVKVAACAINFPDTLIIRDMYQFKPPRPFAPGGEISGTTSPPGANGRGGLYWYLSRMISLSGQLLAPAATLTSTSPLPAVGAAISSTTRGSGRPAPFDVPAFLLALDAFRVHI